MFDISIRKIQTSFRQTILNQDFQSLAEFTCGPMQEPHATSNVEAGLAVYENNYRQTLISVMKQTFPASQNLVGTECFTQLCQSYISKNPSQDHGLHKYGAAFSDFLSTIRGMQESTPYLPDVANAEFHLHQSYFAKDRTQFPFDTFLATTHSDHSIQLKLQEDLFLLSSNFPLDVLLSDLKHHDSGLQYEIKLRHFIIERRKYKPEISSISKIDFQFLTQIQAKRPLEALPESDQHASNLIEKAITQGRIGGFYVSR